MTKRQQRELLTRMRQAGVHNPQVWYIKEVGYVASGHRPGQRLHSVSDSDADMAVNKLIAEIGTAYETSSVVSPF